MPDSIKVVFEAEKLTQALKKYAEVSRMDHASVLEKKGKQLSIELYKESRKYVPAPMRIRDEANAVLNRGGRLKVSDGARAWSNDAVVIHNRGKNAFLAGTGRAHLIGKREGGRLAGSRSRLAVKSGNSINVPATLMASEIAWRIKHRFVTASSWLYRRWRPQGRNFNGSRRYVLTNNYHGSRASVSLGGTSMYVRLDNEQAGVLKQNERRGIIPKAIAQVTGDMLVYLKRKHEQRAAQFSRMNPIFR